MSYKLTQVVGMHNIRSAQVSQSLYNYYRRY